MHFRALICFVLSGAVPLTSTYIFDPNYWCSQWEVNILINSVNKKKRTSFNVNLVLLLL